MYSPSNGNDKEIDGRYANEMIQFVFDQAVTLISITFGKVNKNDDFDFYFDAGFGLAEIDNNIDIPKNDQYIFSTLWTGTTFGFGANDRSDSFTIKNIEVAAANITAIPLPAALPLYGSGLALMSFLGWRRRQKGVTQA
ncbi:hypothetical protein [Sneathiella sp.]|uniref:hypothetical protein n=1 Tax=Sneathiella sp. TaxID=1964365 RepID=UPI0035646241